MFDWFMKRTKGDHKLEEKYTLDAGNLYYDQVLSGVPSIQTADPNNRITNVYAGNSWTSIGHLPGGYAGGTISTTSISDSKITIDGGANGSMRVDVPLIVNGRDVIKELDELREAVLLVTRDLNLEEQYPELKQAYDDYMKFYRSIKIADKLAKTGDT